MDFPKAELEKCNPIYREFFSKSKLEARVEKTKWRGRDSSNSFCFINPEVKYKQRENVVFKKLKEVFDIQSDSFNNKYYMAISGDGQEVKRISTLHSSSLAALLLLYSISKNKELKCSLDGKDYTFNDCFYEVKTNVKDSHYSNMDVVLVGKNSENKDIIFFLESKFREYLKTGMCNNISLDAYEEIYDKLGLNNYAIPGLHFVNGTGKDNEKCLQIKSDTPQYCDGIKQMISHYIGVTHFIDKGVEAMDPKQKSYFEKLDELRKNGADFILGEVLFAFDDTVDKGAIKLSKYSSIYEKLAKKLNDNPDKPSNLHVLPNVLTYQELLAGFELDNKVKAFYQL